MKRLKELWSVPKNKVLFQLGGYFIFFLLIFVFASFGSDNNVKPKEEVNTNLSYNTMKDNLKNGNVRIKYNINSKYYLEGNIIDGELLTTFEEEDILKKIKIINEEIYVINKDEEVIDNSLLQDINLLYLYPSNIFTIIKDFTPIMRQTDDNKIYNYSDGDKSISVFLNEEEIEKIIILDGSITYNLEYNLIK